jgi:hypothetical protein
MNHRTIFRVHACVMLLCLLAVVSGCQTFISAKEATGANADAEGLRYYLPAPYLIIEQAADAKWDARLELGVDRSREFYVQPKAIFAKVNTIISFNDDGTLKSFKLDADSTAVPSAVVAAAKDVELKRLELEKAALDEAQKKKDEKKGGTGALVNVAGARAFRIYRVEGERVVGNPPQEPTQFVDRNILFAAAASKPDEISTDPPSLVVQPSQDQTNFVIKFPDKDLRETDKAKLRFFTSVNPPKEKPIDPTMLVLQGGVILVKKELMQDVKRVTLNQ